MKILVLVKETFDTEARIELDSTGKIVDTNIKKIMNPYDEYAVEEAIQIKEKQGAEITVISLGPDKAVDILRQALAMGADKAVLLNDPAFLGGDEYSRAKILAKAINEIEYDLILAGWVAIDDGSAQIASRVAEILNIPQITVVTNLQFVAGKVLADREIDGGIEKIEATLPVLITVQKGINEPRYPSFKGIMQAKKKELKKISSADLNLDIKEIGEAEAKVVVEEIYLPSRNKSCKIIEGEPLEACSQLVELLRSEAKVI